MNFRKLIHPDNLVFEMQLILFKKKAFYLNYKLLILFDTIDTLILNFRVPVVVMARIIDEIFKNFF